MTRECLPEGAAGREEKGVDDALGEGLRYQGIAQRTGGISQLVTEQHGHVSEAAARPGPHVQT